MKVAFLGTPDLAVPFLEALVDAGHDVPLVVTQRDRAVGRSRTPQPPPVKRRALELGLPVAQPAKLKSGPFPERLGEIRPDALVVVAYGRILPRFLFEAPRHGSINVHFSLLPKYRGAAPVQWCLARGETVTGVTTMRISEGLDEGDILLRERVEIEPGEHAPALGRRLAAAGVPLLLRTLRGIEADTIRPEPQDHASATLAPILRKDDGRPPIDMTASEIEGRVRGFDPWPGVWFRFRGRRIRILEASARPDRSDAPAGRIESLEADSLVVAFGGGTRLGIRRLQPQGGKPMAARDAVNGRHVVPGEELESDGSSG